MAFQMEFEIEAGTDIAKLQNDPSIASMILTTPKTITNGYVKVESFNSVSDSQMLANITYRVNKDDETWYKEESYICPLDLSDDAKNPKKQIYEYLKTKPEFQGATDILENGQTK